MSMDNQSEPVEKQYTCTQLREAGMLKDDCAVAGEVLIECNAVGDVREELGELRFANFKRLPTKVFSI